MINADLDNRVQLLSFVTGKIVGLHDCEKYEKTLRRVLAGAAGVADEPRAVPPARLVLSPAALERAPARVRRTFAPLSSSDDDDDDDDESEISLSYSEPATSLPSSIASPGATPLSGVEVPVLCGDPGCDEFWRSIPGLSSDSRTNGAAF